MDDKEKLRIIRAWSFNFYMDTTDIGKHFGSITYTSLGLFREHTAAHWDYSNAVNEAYGMVMVFIWGIVNAGR